MPLRMLSRKEKNEMLADALDISRRDNFRAVGIKTSNVNASMDSYMHFLNNIQAVCGPFEYKYLKNPHPTHNNKL
jgi:biotin synthase-related radical SAM superfamily protein